MASELTLRIMQRIVDKKNGTAVSTPPSICAGRTQSREIHLSNNEENSLKQLIGPAGSGRSGSQSTAPKAASKSKTVQDFAASYNKGGDRNGTRPSRKPAPVKSKTMNLNDFVQTMKK